jgi:hypothetical protein
LLGGQGSIEHLNEMRKDVGRDEPLAADLEKVVSEKAVSASEVENRLLGIDFIGREQPLQMPAPDLRFDRRSGVRDFGACDEVAFRPDVLIIGGQ